MHLIESFAAHVFAGLGWLAGLAGAVVAVLLYAGRVLLPTWLAPVALGVLAVAFIGTTLSKDGVIAGEREKAIAAERRAEAADNRINAMQRDLAQADANAVRTVLAMREHWQTRIAALDVSTQKEIDHARTENDRLRAGMRAGTVRVRLAGTQVCASASGANLVPSTPAPGGVGNAAPEFDAALRERVLDLRGAIGDVEQQVKYLQAYALACQGRNEQ